MIYIHSVTLLSSLSYLLPSISLPVAFAPPPPFLLLFIPLFLPLFPPICVDAVAASLSPLSFSLNSFIAILDDLSFLFSFVLLASSTHHYSHSFYFSFYSTKYFYLVKKLFLVFSFWSYFFLFLNQLFF